jgi:hypothetical protein
LVFARSIQFSDLVDAPLVAASGKLRAEKFRDDGDGFVLAHDFAAERDHVRVIVLARSPRRKRIMRQRRTNSFYFIRRDRNADPRGANQDAESIVRRGNALPNRFGVSG